MDYQSYGYDFGELPMEIVIEIFQYLHPMDRSIAGLTCKNWLDTTNYSSFTDDSSLNFSNITMQDNTLPARNFLESFRAFPSISFTDVEFNDCNLFWQRHGEHVLNISFNMCDIQEKRLVSILKQLPNLEVLKIEGCRELFMSGLFDSKKELLLDKAHSLSLANNRYLTDSLFNRIVSSIPNLEKLDISECHISFHKGLYRKFYPANSVDPSESVLTFHFINQFIQRQALKLKVLNFNGTLIDGNTLIMLSEITDLKLTELNLRSCDQLTNDGIISLMKVQTSLTFLDFSKCVRLTDQALIEIVENLKQLKSLKLRGCRALTDLSVKRIGEMANLEVLDISECESVTTVGIIEGIAAKKNLVMKKLYVSALDLCESSILRITENLSKLRVLDLSFCFNGVNDLCVQMILKNLTCLRELNLNNCDKISDAGMTGKSMLEKVDEYEKSIIENSESENKKDSNSLVSVVNDAGSQILRAVDNFSNISAMNEFRPFKISLRSKAEEEIVNDAKRKRTILEMYEKSTELLESGSSSYSISRLQGLRVLKIGSCNKISDVSLKYNFKLPELRHVNLSRCQQISIIGIESLVEHCPSLESVDLTECHNINDKCVELVTSKLKRLSSLNLQRCNQLTDFSLDSVAVNCTRLRELNVLGCRGMCSEPNLRLVNVKTLKKIIFSKPGPYVSQESVRRPIAPPLPYF